MWAELLTPTSVRGTDLIELWPSAAPHLLGSNQHWPPAQDGGSVGALQPPCRNTPGLASYRALGQVGMPPSVTCPSASLLRPRAVRNVAMNIHHLRPDGAGRASAPPAALCCWFKEVPYARKGHSLSNIRINLSRKVHVIASFPFYPCRFWDSLSGLV